VKKIVILLGLMLVIYSCQDLMNFEEKPINLGAIATSTQILNLVSVAGKVTATFDVTVGAKYSVQVYPFGSLEPVKSIGFTAEQPVVTRTYNFTDLPEGLYDLTLTDISGVSIKKPLILKRK